jgi:hypothetical protein
MGLFPVSKSQGRTSGYAQLGSGLFDDGGASSRAGGRTGEQPALPPLIDDEILW